MASSLKLKLRGCTWTKDRYLISTDPAHVPMSTLIDVFASDDFYWAKTLPPSAMEEMLDNSLCFGLYELPSSPRDQDLSAPANTEKKFIGIARCVTDFVTFVYLTDVWVNPTYQGKGLGSWLVKCVQEVIEVMPHLRRSMLFTADWGRSVPFYERIMEMQLIETKHGEGLAIMERKGRGHPSFGREGSGYN